MNTFWLKIAGIAVLAVVVIVAIGVFTSKSGPKPDQWPKNIYEQWDEDERRLTAQPQFKEPPVPQPTPQPGPNEIVQPSQRLDRPELTTEGPTEPPKPQFKKLPLEEEIEAQRLWEWVRNQRKMGRLPIMGYKQMVDTCREIIRRWPESEYAFYAKRALAELPERYRKMYNITDEEIDLGNLK